MPKTRVYTVQCDITATEADFLAYRRNLASLPHVANVKVLDTKDLSKVVYPAGGIYDVEEIHVTFNGRVSKDAVEKIVEYWNAIRYVSGVIQVDWQGYNVAVINFDPTKSPSDDLNERNVLELLAQFLEEGSPTRSRHPYGRAVEGVGADAVKSLVGK